MILTRQSSESWLEATQRYASLDGFHPHRIYNLYLDLTAEGYSERRAAFLTLATLGVIDDVDSVHY